LTTQENNQGCQRKTERCQQGINEVSTEVSTPLNYYTVSVSEETLTPFKENQKNLTSTQNNSEINTDTHPTPFIETGVNEEVEKTTETLVIHDFKPVDTSVDTSTNSENEPARCPWQQAKAVSLEPHYSSPNQEIIDSTTINPDIIAVEVESNKPTQQTIFEANANLLRECIQEQDWNMIAQLTSDWESEFKSQVWDCLTQTERADIRTMKVSLLRSECNENIEGEQQGDSSKSWSDSSEPHTEANTNQSEVLEATLRQKITYNWDNKQELGRIILAATESIELRAIASGFNSQQLHHIKDAAKQAWKPNCTSIAEYCNEKVELWEFNDKRNWKVRSASGSIIPAARGNVYPWLGI
jgi:hypothetical protein